MKIENNKRNWKKKIKIMSLLLENELKNWKKRNEKKLK